MYYFTALRRVTDLHRDKIDLSSKQGKGQLKRIEEGFRLFMPYAQHHYPFENKELYRPDMWIVLYSSISTHLFGKAPWKNLIVYGLVLAADVKKMSKSQKNYPDPNDIINLYDADATRMFLVNSPVVRGDNLRFREEGVREEMAAYRLYAIIPRLLDLVDELTNWYIRFNHRRLKGEDGLEDIVAALNTIFETFFTLCRMMSSYTPFSTENIYQSLRQFIPEYPAAGDARSIHILSFPEVKHEYFERQVKRMQTIIELTRNIRERHNISLNWQLFQTTLRELLVFHADEQWLEDAKGRGPRWGALPRRCRLGCKLRKDLARVKNALPSMPSDAVLAYVQNDGIELVTGDLTVQRYIELPEQVTGQSGVAQNATHTDNDIVVRLDIEVHVELQSKWLTRELINRIQKLRKRGAAGDGRRRCLL
ncbi:hypothetical protein BKA93DRAFT_924664 [Sparassis latifolia]